MRTLCSLCGALAMIAGLAAAETWTGTLLDAGCYNRHHMSAKTCDAKTSTTSFLLNSNGKIYTLDRATSDRVREAMRSRADRLADFHQKELKHQPVNATVNGRMKSDGHIRAETVEIQ